MINVDEDEILEHYGDDDITIEPMDEKKVSSGA